MSTAIGLVQRVFKAFNPPISQPSAESAPLKFGILGAAAIAPVAIISPALNHPEAVVYAIAARDKARATAFAKKYGIDKAYGGPNGYQDLLDDPEIDVIYNPLPNGLHYEWTMKALAAGKHVLLEKPAANTAEETRQMFEIAEQKGLVLLEAFHYRFHPAIQRVKAIIDSGELGKLKHISAALTTPRGFVKPTDIRYDYKLGGGVMMDMGCYTLNCIRYLSSSNPTSVFTASAEPSFKLDVDRATTAQLALPNDVTATLKTDFATPFSYFIIPSLPQVCVNVTLDGGEIELFNFVVPTLYHSIKVHTKVGGKAGKRRVEKAYTFAEGKLEGKGEAWWTTYRYQLEAFVDRVRGRTPQTWLDKEDSIANLYWIEQVYAKTGLGSRPKSEFVPSQTEPASE